MSFHANFVLANESNDNHGCRIAWGYIDRKGRFAIKPNLKSARDFSSGLAWVQPLGESNRSKIELIDNKGKIRFANKSESSPFDFQCGLAVARDDSNHKFGYINREGDTAIPYKFAQAESFVDGIAKVALFENGHYTYFHIDTSGNTVSNDRKTVSSRFNAGGAVAKDSDGHLVFIPAGLNGDHIRYGNFSEGLAPVAWWSSKMTRCNGFVDRSMRIALTLAPEVEDVGEFHDGLAAVLVTQPGLDQLGRPLCHQIGFIDKTGKLVIPAKFEAERIGQGLDDVHFSDGIARVNFDGYSCCYINTKGELIGKFCQGGDFEDGLAAVAVIVDANGSVLDPADNSRGYQTRTGYALDLRDLLKNPLAELRSSKQIEFGLEPEEHKITDVKITQSSGSADLDERLISIVRSIVPPKQGLLLAPRAPFTFELLNGKLSIGFTKRRGGAL